MPASILESPRIRLRPMRADDANALFALHSDPQVMSYLMSLRAWRDPAEATTYLAAMVQAERHGAIPWAIADRDDDVLIGELVLFGIMPEQARCTFGCLLQRARWGQGIGREAAQMGLAHAFASLDLKRVEAEIHPENQASIRLAERLGFKQEGRMRQRWNVDGEWLDSAIFGLLSEEFVGA